jgi:putative hydrolase of the HAD superfamily
VRAVLLDLDDTLIEEEAHARTQLRRTAQLLDGVQEQGWDDVVIDSARQVWHSSPYEPDFRQLGFASWEGLWSTFEGVHPRLEGLASWARGYRTEAWRRALEAVDRDPDAHAGLVDALSARYVEGQRSGHPVLPGAVELVTRLAAAVPVAIVTNGPPDIQRLKIAQTGIAPLLSAVVISGETGIGKPDPASYGQALELLGVAPEHAVMVGDNWERDVTGALDAGLGAIWISQGRPLPQADPRVTVAEGPRHVTLFS